MDASSDLNILQIMWHSGIVVKLVLLLLIGFSVYSWTIIFKKIKQHKLRLELNDDFYRVYSSTDNLDDVALKIENLPASPLKYMFEEGYRELSKIRGGSSKNQSAASIKEHLETFGLSILERGLQKGVHRAKHSMNELLPTLASIGSISPFVGLFGTVWGIIDSFQGLAGGGGTLEAVAPGIAEALVATAVGLAAAIPAVWFYNKFNSENKTVMEDMESFGEDFLNSVERTVIRTR